MDTECIVPRPLNRYRARRSIDYPAILSDPATVIRALAVPVGRTLSPRLAVRPELHEPGKRRFMHRGTKNPARPINRSPRRNPFKYFAFAEPRARARCEHGNYSDGFPAKRSIIKFILFSGKSPLIFSANRPGFLCVRVKNSSSFISRRGTGYIMITALIVNNVPASWSERRGNGKTNIVTTFRFSRDQCARIRSVSRFQRRDSIGSARGTFDRSGNRRIVNPRIIRSQPSNLRQRS